MTALARITCDPAAILGIAAGSLEPGLPADICIFDPAKHWALTPASLHSQGKNTPFLGQTMQGQTRFTLIGGRVVFAAGKP